MPIKSNISNQPIHPRNHYYGGHLGGHQTRVFDYAFLEPYLIPDYPNTLDIKGSYSYTNHVNNTSLYLYPTENFVHTQIPTRISFLF